MTLDEYFEGNDRSRQLFEALRGVIESIGAAEIRVTKSQVAFRRRKAFAWAWIPGKYLRGRGAPLVLTLSFRHKDSSPRWKEIVEPAPGRFTHHLELYSAGDIDDEVRGWLQACMDKQFESTAPNLLFPYKVSSNLTLLLHRIDNLPMRFCYNRPMLGDPTGDALACRSVSGI